MKEPLLDGRRWNGLAYLHDTPQVGCNCPTCAPAEPVAAIAPGAMLGQNAEEAQRMTYGGRPMRLLKERKTFDSGKLENSPLFSPSKPRLF